MAEGAEGAYLAGLKLLAQRELSELQLRDRLVRRRFDPEAVDAAVERLRRERVVDDRRAALACVRAQVNVRHRGRLRVLHELRGIGIDRDTARRAVDEVFGELDEDRL